MISPRSFWTPRYVADRLALAAHQRRNPDLPWWPREVIGHLEDLLRPTDRCFEWGSGRSTAWLAARTASVTSIEHDREWFEIVHEQLSEAFPSATIKLLDTAPTERPEESEYVRAVEEFDDGTLDLAIVDGRYRGKCALAAIPKVAPGGMLLVDDANWFLERDRTRAPHSRNGRGPRDEDWARYTELTRDWRSIWSTDGVTDTAIWIKPCGAALSS